MSKTGLILSSPRIFDWKFAGQTAIDLVVRRVDGQWMDYLPVKEAQNALEQWKFDSLGCVSFSANNCIEILHNFIYGVEINLSDRFLAKMSGTTLNGNTFINVADSIRDYGFIEENKWPFVAIDQDGDGDFDWSDFYKDISSDILKEAKLNLELYDIHYDWVDLVNNERKMSALQYAPLQITMKYASFNDADKDGIIHYDGGKEDHAVILVGYEVGVCWYIFDTYAPFLKKIAWSYPIGQWSMRYNITKKNMGKPVIANNALIFEAEGIGRAGLYVDGKIIVDELPKILLQYEMLNVKFPNVKNLTTTQFNAFQHINLKREVVQ